MFFARHRVSRPLFSQIIIGLPRSQGRSKGADVSSRELERHVHDRRDRVSARAATRAGLRQTSTWVVRCTVPRRANTTTGPAMTDCVARDQTRSAVSRQDTVTISADPPVQSEFAWLRWTPCATRVKTTGLCPQRLLFGGVRYRTHANPRHTITARLATASA